MNLRPVAPPVTEYLYRKATQAGVPLSGTFELTPFCNMNCKMCYVRLEKSGQTHPLSDAKAWLALGEKAAQAGMLYLLITGGEPFSHPEIRQILQGLHKLGLLITVNTNGTLIDEQTVAWLKESPPLRINISLYGASNETYGRLCGNPVGFTQTCRAISLLTQANIPVKLNCSLTPENKDDLEKIVAFSKEQNLPLQVATYMFPPLRKNSQSVGKNHRFSPREAAKYMRLADRLIAGTAIKQTVPEIPDWDAPCGDVGEKSRCRAGRCSFWITWKGEMLPCGMFPTEGKNNVFCQDFEAVWQQVKVEVAGLCLPAMCASCEGKDICRACAAMVITESGNYQQVPKYRCEMMRAYFDLCKEEQKNEK